MALNQGFSPPGQRFSDQPQSLTGSPFDFNIGTNFNGKRDNPWNSEQMSLNFNGIDEGSKRAKTSPSQAPLTVSNMIASPDPTGFFLNESFLNGWNRNYARGYPTNRHVNQRYLVKEWSSEFMNNEQKGQLVFLNRRSKTETRDYPFLGTGNSQWGDEAVPSWGGDKERDSVLSLPGINFLYASREKFPTDFNNVMTTQNIMEVWSLAGVVRT